MKVEALPQAKKDMAKLFGYRFDEESYYPWWEENILWPLEKIWTKITDIPDQIKYFWQRGIRGYADCDWWDLNDYLADWLPKALRDLRTKGIGGDKDRLEEIKKMEEGFRAWRKMDEIRDPRKPSYKKQQAIFDKGMKSFHNNFGHLWD